MSALIILQSNDDRAIPLPGELATHVESSWSRGEPKPRGGVKETSGQALSLSSADIAAIEQQVEDATAFLLRHAAAWRAHVQTLDLPRAELVLTSCIPTSSAAQEITLPVELVAAAASLGMSISLRTFLTGESAA